MDQLTKAIYREAISNQTFLNELHAVDPDAPTPRQLITWTNTQKNAFTGIYMAWCLGRGTYDVTRWQSASQQAPLSNPLPAPQPKRRWLNYLFWAGLFVVAILAIWAFGHNNGKGWPWIFG